MHLRRRIYKDLWAKKNPKSIRAGKLRREYGLSYDDYQYLWEQQDGVCAICFKVERSMSNGKVRSLAVDHDHATKQIRGLLCDKCNRAVGFLDDDPLRAEALARYLRQS